MALLNRLSVYYFLKNNLFFHIFPLSFIRRQVYSKTGQTGPVEITVTQGFGIWKHIKFEINA